MINVSFGVGTVTKLGLRFYSKIYTNGSMKNAKWFEHAEIHGEWNVPVVFDSGSTNFIALYDMVSFEVVSSVDNDIMESVDELLLFFSAIEDLKDTLRGHPR